VSDSTSFADQNYPAGWSPHELALFYRAARLLSSQSIHVETDYGLSDEGEPWLVLCDAESGDVFGHFARMHEEYIACVPFRRCALTGWELSELLGRFLRRRGITWSTVTRPIVRNVDRLAAIAFAILQCA
jgi:hypothetical protein